MEERFDKILKIWNDSTGNIFYREDMINIEKIEVVNHILYVTLKNNISSFPVFQEIINHGNNHFLSAKSTFVKVFKSIFYV